MPEPYCPQAGDIVWLDFDPQLGREQAGRRPALVLSPYAYNTIARLCVVCPITTSMRPWKLATPLPPSLRTNGTVLTDHVKSLSWAERRAEFVEAAPPALLADVRAKIAALLQIA